MIDDGIFKTIDDYHDIVLDTEFTPHIFNERCLYSIGLNKLNFRKPNNSIIRKYNKKYMYKELPNKYENESVENFKTSIFEVDEVHENGYDPFF